MSSLNTHRSDSPEAGANDLVDVYVAQLIPGVQIIERLLVSPDANCSIKLDNPEGQDRRDRVTIPIQNLTARAIRLPARLKGEKWIVVIFSEKTRQVVRGRTLEQWRKLYELRYDFDVLTEDGKDYFE